MGRSIYPVAGYESVLPDSLLATSLAYCSQLHSSDPDDQHYSRLMVRTGLEWACHKAEHEGRPNAHNDIPLLDVEKLNYTIPLTAPSAV